MVTRFLLAVFGVCLGVFGFATLVATYYTTALIYLFGLHFIGFALSIIFAYSVYLAVAGFMVPALYDAKFSPQLEQAAYTGVLTGVPSIFGTIVWAIYRLMNHSTTISSTTPYVLGVWMVGLAIAGILVFATTHDALDGIKRQRAARLATA